ncbi:phosphatidylinositol mannoside acyltransferase [Streptomyces durbertensis]|uniref:Phosphatidylinositol mannoside acyltransferase n=1 Tax=Streptomyces durbertensis TaxID=2448886 RepID=A0ABR6EIF3_9ACTN|nr:phosphatidylinositol mannoside acyltransferase [Streptomyces durbertensis]MBB1245110.1 phosphatidylinositol mannoside acyltransferase [Streptomyces durbertensis]
MRERLTDGLYGLGWGAVKRLPERTAVGLGRTVADRTWKRRGKAVRQLEANLARVVPDASPERLRELSRAGMRSYLRYWMEAFRLPAWSAERIGRSVYIHDLHHLTDSHAAGKGTVLALPHLANWDLAGAWLASHLGIPFTTVAERLKPESLYDRFVAYREGLGMEVLPHEGGAAFGTLARRMRAGGMAALVADRDLSASGIEVDFFGEKARMPGGPALLALQTGARLLPATLWYDGTPVLKGRVHPPVAVPTEGTRAEKAAAMTQRMADRFAEGIAAHPEDWHMLQRLWLSDLEPRDTGQGADPASGPAAPLPQARPSDGTTADRQQSRAGGETGRKP